MNQLHTFLLAAGVSLMSGMAASAEETAPPTAAQLKSHPEVQGALAAIDAAFAGVYHYDRVPGISAGIVYDQELIWSSGYGFANLDSKRPADVDTLYSICSISKLFTSIGIMQQRDAGMLTLRDTVEQHLEWFDLERAHPDSAPITIEGLLTHSSGLPRESDFPYWNGPDFPFPTSDEMRARLSSQQTLYAAERVFQYSNLALSLAGEIVQEVSGQPYADYVSANILQPLGLTDTRPYYPVQLRGEQLAIGYTGIHRDGERRPVAPFFTRGITAAAGFTSSVGDLARFASWQFRLLGEGGNEVLDANTLREMQRVHWVDPDWETTWGIGFSIRRVEKTTVVGHGGGCPGYITSFSMLPKHKLAAIVLTNAGDGPAGKLAAHALKTMGKAMKSAQQPVEDEMPDYSRFEGNYDSTPWGGEVAVRQWGDKLVVINIGADEFGGDPTRLKHVDGSTFVRLTDEDEPREPWVFELGEGNKATTVRLHSIFMSRID